MRNGHIWIAAIFILFVAYWLYGQRWPILINFDQNVAAKLACKEWTKDWLNDPASASFDDLSKYDLRIDGNKFTVRLGVRARNGFNALIYIPMECDFHRLDTEHGPAFVPDSIDSLDDPERAKP